MNFITKEELEKKDIVSKFSVINRHLILPENYEYKTSFDVGDIVSHKNNTNELGVVYFIEDDELSINWNNGTEGTEDSTNLIVVPPTVGLELLKDSNLIDLWEDLSNGKNESFDLKCIYLNDKVINEVPFIKAFKNTNTIIDKGLDTSRYVYYLLENNIVYYLGIDLNEKDLTTYLFNK